MPHTLDLLFALPHPPPLHPRKEEIRILAEQN